MRRLAGRDREDIRGCEPDVVPVVAEDPRERGFPDLVELCRGEDTGIFVPKPDGKSGVRKMTKN